MGFAAVAAVAILMIAGVATFANYQTEADSAQDEIRKAEREREAREHDLLLTSIVVTSSNYQNGPNRLILDLTNEGATTLDTTKIDVIIDGVVRTDDITWIRSQGNDDRYWHPLTDVEIRLDDITQAPDRVAVVTHNGFIVYEEI